MAGGRQDDGTAHGQQARAAVTQGGGRVEAWAAAAALELGARRRVEGAVLMALAKTPGLAGRAGVVDMAAVAARAGVGPGRCVEACRWLQRQGLALFWDTPAGPAALLRPAPPATGALPAVRNNR
jgi:hypothetical protein